MMLISTICLCIVFRFQEITPAMNKKGPKWLGFHIPFGMTVKLHLQPLFLQRGIHLPIKIKGYFTSKWMQYAITIKVYNSRLILHFQYSYIDQLNLQNLRFFHDFFPVNEKENWSFRHGKFPVNCNNLKLFQTWPSSSTFLKHVLLNDFKMNYFPSKSSSRMFLPASKCPRIPQNRAWTLIYDW